MPAHAPLSDRFWPKVNKTKTCWLWTGAKNDKGYGQIWMGDRVAYAHRVSVEMVRGAIPPFMVVDHLCRTPLCVNPDHLEVVSQKENMRRAEPAARTHCPHGHEYTAENTTVYRRKRFCRTCARNRARERQSRIREQRSMAA